MLDTPEVWYSMGEYIHQDFLLQFPDFISGLRDFFGDASEEEVNDMRIFLNELKKLHYSDEQLERLWLNSGSNLVWDGAGVRAILGELEVILSEVK